MTVARLSLRAGNDSWPGCVPTTLSHNPFTMSNLSPPPATVRLTGALRSFLRTRAACQKLAGVIVRLGFEAEAFHSPSELQAGLAREPFAACVIDEPESLTVVQQTESFARQNGRPTQFVVLPSLGSRTHLPSTPTTCEILDPPHTPDKLARALFAAVGRPACWPRTSSCVAGSKGASLTRSSATARQPSSFAVTCGLSPSIPARCW